MSKPSHPRRRQSARAPSEINPPAVASRIVWLRIAFSARFDSAPEDVDRRLCEHLRRSGITAWMTGRAVLLLGCDRPTTPADWSAVIGWLLCQPEVVFVARELPLSTTTKPMGGAHGQAR